MADLTDEEIAAVRAELREAEGEPWHLAWGHRYLPRLLDEVVRRRKREEAILSALDRIAPGTKRNVLAALECTE